MAAGVRRQDTYLRDHSDIFLELVPVVLGIKATGLRQTSSFASALFMIWNSIPQALAT